MLAKNEVKIELSFCELTPELAKQWLATMRPNRPCTLSHVMKIADQITAGLWNARVAPIRFDGNGRMVDGQHRCHAVIITGQPVEVMIERRVPETVFDLIDTNIKERSKADTHAIWSGGELHSISSSVNMIVIGLGLSLFGFKRIFHGGRSRITNAYISDPARQFVNNRRLHREIREHYQEAIDAVLGVITVNVVTPFLKMPFVVAATKAYGYEDHQRVIEFLQVAKTGKPMSDTSYKEDMAAFTWRNHALQFGKSLRAQRDEKNLVSLLWKCENAIWHFCRSHALKHAAAINHETYPQPWLKSLLGVD